jgi:hypothetical protein
VTKAKIKAICRQVSENWLGQTGRLDQTGIALYQVIKIFPTTQLEVDNREMWQTCGLEGRTPGLLCLISRLPTTSTRLFLVSRPPIFPREAAGLPIYYATVTRNMNFQPVP